MLREALNVEDDEGMRIEHNDEPTEDCKPLLARKRTIKPRSSVKIPLKKEEPAVSGEYIYFNFSPLNGCSSKIAK